MQKRNQDFLIQLEAEKQMVESLKLEIAGSEDKQAQNYRNFESYLTGELENQKRLQEKYEKELASYNKNLSGLDALLQGNTQYLKTLEGKIVEGNNDVLNLRERIDSLDKAISGYGLQLQEIEKRFQEFQGKQVVIN
jgi:chromosome segregation ATPase